MFFLRSLIIFSSFIYCNNLNQDILVKVNDRTITKNEFIKRSEYTIRPHYCKGDNNIDKKIILNSLIAEKLMAIEIEDNLLSDDFSNNFIEGLKEQKMREAFFENEIYNSIQIDSSLIQKYFINATKEYNVQFLSIGESELSKEVDSLLRNDIAFEEICHDYFFLDEIPNKKINFFDEYDPHISRSIFSKNLIKNQVIGPILSKDKRYLYLKILGWSSEPAITHYDKSKLWDDVKSKIYKNKCLMAYDDFVLSIMTGLKMEIIEEPFLEFLNREYDKYYRNVKNEKQIYWDIPIIENKEYSINPNQQLLFVNEKQYKISDIDLLIEKHPLVFRKEQITKNNFPLQLKYAIADLIRDEEINYIAYQENYDNHPDVKKEIAIFRDAILSTFHLRTYLEGKNISIEDYNKNHINVIENHLNDYIEYLISKNTSKISINFNLLDQIKLTHIDLYAYKKGAPYPFVVPTFPILTTKYKLDYGKEMNLP